MRRLLGTLLAAACALAAAPAADARSSYCSPTGDYCYGVQQRDGVWRISLHTFSFRGRVRTCVTAPDGSRACRRFRVREQRGGIYGFRVRWSRWFPNRGLGRYRVTFAVGGSKIGPGVSFRRG